MPPDAHAYIWDARRAAALIEGFTSGREWKEYVGDPMLRSAVERQFEIIGEALNRLTKTDPETAGKIADLPRIVSFRNVLIHGYATVDDAIVWEVATQRLHDLIQTLDGLLPEDEPTGDPPDDESNLR